jgi:hypothetical protein
MMRAPDSATGELSGRSNRAGQPRSASQRTIAFDPNARVAHDVEQQPAWEHDRALRQKASWRVGGF